jgi:hypothetical protein
MVEIKNILNYSVVCAVGTGMSFMIDKIHSFLFLLPPFCPVIWSNPPGKFNKHHGSIPHQRGSF